MRRSITRWRLRERFRLVVHEDVEEREGLRGREEDRVVHHHQRLLLVVEGERRGQVASVHRFGAQLQTPRVTRSALAVRVRVVLLQQRPHEERPAVVGQPEAPASQDEGDSGFKTYTFTVTATSNGSRRRWLSRRPLVNRSVIRSKSTRSCATC